MRRRKCCRLRVGCTSLDNAANLLGITRTAQGSPLAGIAQHLRRRLAFVSRAKRTALHKRRHRLHRAMRGQFLRPLGPLGGDDDPFLGEKILA